MTLEGIMLVRFVRGVDIVKIETMWQKAMKELLFDNKRRQNKYNINTSEIMWRTTRSRDTRSQQWIPTEIVIADNHITEKTTKRQSRKIERLNNFGVWQIVATEATTTNLSRQMPQKCHHLGETTAQRMIIGCKSRAIWWTTNDWRSASN